MNRQPPPEILPTPLALCEAAARYFFTAMAAAVAERGVFRVALSGGSTPGPLYHFLATATTSSVPWPAVEVYWSDERCVPPEDPASNYGMVRTKLLDRVPVEPTKVHRMRGEDDPADAATAYELSLRTAFGTLTGPPTTRSGARLDLILLGLGSDGHVASLFPGLLPPPTTERWVIPVAATPWPRLSFTPPLINSAREVMVLVSGAPKAGIVRQVFKPAASEAELPAHLLRPADGTLRWLLDAAAAARLPA